MAHLELQKLLKIIYTCDHTGCHAVLSGDLIRAGERVEEADLERNHNILATEEAARDQIAQIFHDDGWEAVDDNSGFVPQHYCPLHATQHRNAQHQEGTPQ